MRVGKRIGVISCQQFAIPPQTLPHYLLFSTRQQSFGHLDHFHSVIWTIAIRPFGLILRLNRQLREPTRRGNDEELRVLPVQIETLRLAKIHTTRRTCARLSRTSAIYGKIQNGNSCRQFAPRKAASNSHFRNERSRGIEDSFFRFWFRFIFKYDYLLEVKRKLTLGALSLADLSDIVRKRLPPSY